MSQFFFTPLSFQAAQNRYRDRLQAMDKIVFPNGNQSLLDNGMSPEEADKAVENALESRLHQGTVSGNLTFFAGRFSGGKLNLDGKTVRGMILSIAENRELLERGIQNRFSRDTVRVMSGFLAGFGAGCLCGRLSTLAAKAPVSAKALKTLSDTLYAVAPAPLKAAIKLSATSDQGDDNAQFLIILAVIVALVIGGVIYFSQKSGKRSPRLIEDKLPTKEQALEVLTLAECLADIYRNERK